MKIAQELRAGSTIKIGNDPFVVLKAEYNKSGRNAAVVKFKMKNLISGNISDSVYKADDKMDDIKLDKVKAIYSYNDGSRSEEHTSELQSRQYLVCRLLLEK